jgi:hypothetical protein
MKLIITIVAITCVASAAQAQLGPGAYWPPSSRGCASWSIASCGQAPSRAVQKPRPTSRQVRPSR